MTANLPLKTKVALKFQFTKQMRFLQYWMFRAFNFDYTSHEAMGEAISHFTLSAFAMPFWPGLRMSTDPPGS